MDITLDIGAAVLGVAVPLIAFWFNDERKKKEAKAEAKEKARREAEEIRENERREAEERREQDRIEAERSYQELKEAIEIHASLTDLEVTKSLESPKPADKEFLVALHERSSARFDAFRQDFVIPEDIAKLILAALKRIHDMWPAETKDSQRRAEVKAKQNHAKNEWVQGRIEEFATHLAGQRVERGDIADIVDEYKTLMTTIKLTKAGQSVHIGIPIEGHTIYFQGNGKGELPSQIRHLENDDRKKKCDLFAVTKAGLLSHNESGDDLAKAFVAKLRELAGTDGEGRCGCGVPYLPAQSAASPATE